MFDHVQQAKLHLFTFGLLIRPRVPSHLEGCTYKSTMQVVSRIEPSNHDSKSIWPPSEKHLPKNPSKTPCFIRSQDQTTHNFRSNADSNSTSLDVQALSGTLRTVALARSMSAISKIQRTQSRKMQTLKTWNKTLLHLQTHHHRHFTLTCKNPRPLWIFHSSNHTSPLTN